ncbi:MAG: hypothetical protein ACAI35_13425 [Candidatus Methylacidiphilales bacterium]|nr:hypothetical protein [Candidatus Methylacidiphilales bacterium]
MSEHDFTETSEFLADEAPLASHPVINLPPRQQAEEIYTAESLPFPLLPAPFKDAELYQISSTTFATTEVGLDSHSSLYNLEYLLADLLSHSVETPVLAFGFGGHGFASEAVHYYAATPHAIVLVQARWGSYLDNQESVRKAFIADCKNAALIIETAQDAAARNLLPAGQRLVVIESFRSGRCMAWLPSTPVPFHEEAPDLPWEASSAPTLFGHSMLEELSQENPLIA